MKKIFQAAGIVALVSFAAGSALAQAGSAGSAGTTGAVSGSAGATTTGSGIAPADGSNALQRPGGMATQASMPVYHSNVSGAGMVQGDQTRVVDGNRTVITTYYWAGVPSNVQSDPRFQRWQRLR